MKKIILVSLAFLFLGLAPHVLAQNFVPLAPIPGLTDIQPTSGELAAFFNNLYKFLIGLAAVLAIIEIIWGGLEISTKDSVSKQSDGRERITQAIFGLVLVLSPVLVFSIINPSILDLSLNLKPLKLEVPKPKNESVAPKSIETGTMNVITGSGNTTFDTDTRAYPCSNDGSCKEALDSCKKVSNLSEVGCLVGTSFRPADDSFGSSDDKRYVCFSSGALIVKCIKSTSTL